MHTNESANKLILKLLFFDVNLLKKIWYPV